MYATAFVLCYLDMVTQSKMPFVSFFQFLINYYNFSFIIHPSPNYLCKNFKSLFNLSGFTRSIFSINLASRQPKETKQLNNLEF